MQIDTIRNLNETDVLTLVPCYFKVDQDNYYIIKKDNLTILSTSKAGIEVAELMKKKISIGQIKNRLAQQYNLSRETINIVPLLESLYENQFIATINNEEVFKISNSFLIHIRFFLSIYFKSLITDLLFNKIHIKIFYSILRKYFLYKFIVPYENEINNTLTKLKINKFDIRKNIEIQAQLEYGKILYFSLSYKNLKRWFDHYFIVENLHYLDVALKQNKGVILSAFHSGSYNLLPFIIASKGYEVHSPTLFDIDFHRQIFERTKQIDAKGFPLKAHIYNRSKEDGIKLYRVLKENGTILLFCDTHVFLTNDLLTVDFLNTLIKTNRGIAFYHKRTQAPIIPIISYQVESKCYVKFLPQLIVNQDENELDIMQNLFKILEKFIREKPEQWTKWQDMIKLMK